MPTSMVQYILPALIDSDPAQPRQAFDEEALNRLVETVRAQGIRQPIRVYRDGNRFTVVEGERRLRASLLAQLEQVPCIVEDSRPDEHALRLYRLTENTAREGLNPIELALAVEQLVANGMTAAEVANRIGLSEAHVSKLRSLLKRLTPDQRAALQDGKLTLKDAYELVKISRKANGHESRPSRKIDRAPRASKMTVSPCTGISLAVDERTELPVLLDTLSKLTDRIREAQAQHLTLEQLVSTLRPTKRS